MCKTLHCFFFFFFQAEDGIRDLTVTGVQTCALPILHTGDVFFNGGVYPYIDGSTGGRIDGMIEAADRLLNLADADTKIVPGHGPLGTKADYAKYRDMLSTAADRVRKLKASGKSVEDAIAAKPFADLEADWGKGRLNGDSFVKVVYLTL